ncbi:MAG: FMN-binding protein [Treponema sp.]|nr:FMN-binding protein [Treponema sp.]
MNKATVTGLCSLILTLVVCTTACSSKKTFTGKAKGYGGEISVELTVAKDKITAVKITGDKETPGVGGEAVKQMPAAIFKAQTYEVDSVSGATISSTSIKKATKAAMLEAGLIKQADPCDAGGTITLESINKYLNESADMGAGSIANVVAVIPIKHINGPREEHDFYAFVNFKYKARNFIKYQVTYLSCTCRSAEVNYWSTAYVELTLPKSGNIDDSVIKYMSFDYDSEGHYLTGFWGDSNPTPAGATFEDFKREYIPFFIGKDYKYIKTLSTSDDIAPEDYSAGEGRANYRVDSFTGSSVSTNNIIRMLNALYEYHASDEFFANTNS